MKKLIILLVLGLCTGNVVAEGIISKQKLINTMEESLGKVLCHKNYNTCVDTTRAVCLAKVEKIISKECSADIPDELEDLDEVRAYAKSTTTCATTKYIKNHKGAMKKNIKTSACLSLMK